MPIPTIHGTMINFPIKLENESTYFLSEVIINLLSIVVLLLLILCIMDIGDILRLVEIWVEALIFVISS